MPRPPSGLSYAGLTLEGNLLAPAILKQIANPKSDEATARDYDIPRGVTLRDELARYFRIGQAILRHLHASPNPSLAATERFVSELLTQVLGFSSATSGRVQEVDGHLYPVSLEALDGRVPILVVPPSDTLDASSQHLRPDSRRRSAATALQDWLNVSDPALWGICTNGLQLRLLRDNPSLTRPAFLEFDLLQIFENEDYSSFTLFWLLLHRSRFGKPGGPATDCPLERWREEGAKSGELAVKRLAGNVEEALFALANGLLENPANDDLRKRLASGALQLSASSGQTIGSGSTRSFFSQLLRLIYRLIFLLAAEDRDLLHPPDTSTAIRDLYAMGYSVGRLRDGAIRRAVYSGIERIHSDRWQGLLLTFRALAHGEPRLGLPSLGGLFSSKQTLDLDKLHLSNHALFQAMYSLAWLRDGTVPVRVDWRNMQTEELGSVYEGLLELTPRLSDDTRSISFAVGAERKGNERKISGSYYTPDSLVQTLLDSALDPVLDRMEAESVSRSGIDPAAHLLTITVLDPACGSGHFLLAAARRVATRVARIRAAGVPTLMDYRRALRDVVRLCIYGVDRNPMAVELSRVALWIETVEPGKPLGFLDANLRSGDSLVGIFSLEALTHGIPDGAYKPLAGDDKAVAKIFAARNKEDLKGQGRLELFGAPMALAVAPTLNEDALALHSLPEDSENDITKREQAFERFRANPILTRYELAADLYTAAFLIPKVKPSAAEGWQSPEENSSSLRETKGPTFISSTRQNPEFPNMPLVPVTSHVWTVLEGGQILGQLVGVARQTARFARAFHWPLEFPHILLGRNSHGRGFDVVLGNPPWEVMQLSEEEYFMQRAPEIAELSGAKRKKTIALLESSHPAMFFAYINDLRAYQASNEFTRASGRFDLTARGKVNTYALFAELFSSLTNPRGYGGVIVPTGIATDATTAPFFGYLVENCRLARLVDFENRAGLFPNIDSRMKFCLLTMANATPKISFNFFLTDPSQLDEPNRTFSLSPSQIEAMSPNTKTAPVFRSTADAELTARIYESVPVLVNDTRPDGNAWQLTFSQGLFNMTSDSGLFETRAQFEAIPNAERNGNEWHVRQFSLEDEMVPGRYLPLYESKLIHSFDYRWSTYKKFADREVTEIEKCDPGFEIEPRYWVHEDRVAARLSSKEWPYLWLMGWRDITNATNERTVVSSLFPLSACGDTLLLMFPSNVSSRAIAALMGNLCSIVLDYTARQKIGGTHMKYNVFKQLAVLPPARYAESDLLFIVPRVLELTYTSRSMIPFARDLGYFGEPFVWDESRRAQLRAELDAWYARAYGLSRDELRYILDPKDVMGLGYPSETFRVLKKNETAKFGEFRTRRLTLAAWDRQAAGLRPLCEVAHLTLEAPVDQKSNFLSYDDLPNGCWAIHRIEPYNAAVPAARLFAAILNEFVEPVAWDEIGLIYHYAGRPEKLTPFLQGQERATWIRLVGSDAQPVADGALQMQLRSDLPFAEALTWLRSKNAIAENLDQRTWQRGRGDAELPLDGWPKGRARFVLSVLKEIGYDNLRSKVSSEDVVWEIQKHA